MLWVSVTDGPSALLQETQTPPTPTLPQGRPHARGATRPSRGNARQDCQSTNRVPRPPSFSFKIGKQTLPFCYIPPPSSLSTGHSRSWGPNRLRVFPSHNARKWQSRLRSRFRNWLLTAAFNRPQRSRGHSGEFFYTRVLWASFVPRFIATLRTNTVQEKSAPNGLCGCMFLSFYLRSNNRC